MYIDVNDKIWTTHTAVKEILHPVYFELNSLRLVLDDLGLLCLVDFKQVQVCFLFYCHIIICIIITKIL